MPVYLWEGKNRKNEVRKGEMESASEETLRAHLNRIKITPTKIKKKPKDIFEDIEMFQPKVKVDDVIVFSRQFSTMIDAGLPIIQCLDILHNQQENLTFKKNHTNHQIRRGRRTDFCRSVEKASQTVRRSIRQHGGGR
jgi:type IV pilus assembly protein PilC